LYVAMHTLILGRGIRVQTLLGVVLWLVARCDSLTCYTTYLGWAAPGPLEGRFADESRATEGQKAR